MAKTRTTASGKQHGSDSDLCSLEIVEKLRRRRARIAVRNDNHMLLSRTHLHHVIQNHFQRRGETWHVTHHHLLRSILRAALVADDLQWEAPSITILGCRPATVASTT